MIACCEDAPLLSALREFVLVGDAQEPGNSLPQIDDPRFGIATAHKSRTVTRTWLDTFDWRLFRAGLTLELLADRGTAELVLTGRDGELVATEPTGASNGSRPIRWPSRLDQLPAGPLREQLAPVVGVRALLPVAKATSVLTESRAVNTDEKTIAVLAVDRMSVTQPRQSRERQSRERQSRERQSRERQAQPYLRVAVIPLRGYQAQASKVADLLERAPGVAPAVQSPFEAALAGAGCKPGAYTGKIDVRLAGTMPAALALATVLGSLFDSVEANLAGTLADIDTEFLHDLRVAVRRTRSVLKTAKAVLPELAGKYRTEFKWLGDVTTPTRDLDVYLLEYPSMAARLVASTGPELEPFGRYLERERASAYRQLARGLRSARFTSLASRWRHDLDQIASAPRRRPLTAPFAARRIARAHRLVLDSGAAIDTTSPPQALHDLRKFCKELRYLLEVFASLHDPAEQGRAVNELKALQDCLGEFQDTDIQIAELRTFAAAMMADRSAPATTLLAMGEIAAGLAIRQAKARAEFAGRFAAFASPRGRARIGSLAKAAGSRAGRAGTTS
jgi:CHAD domain-containing protein